MSPEEIIQTIELAARDALDIVIAMKGPHDGEATSLLRGYALRLEPKVAWVLVVGDQTPQPIDLDGIVRVRVLGKAPSSARFGLARTRERLRVKSI